jgi:cobalt-zinc-cadmium efflux system outer membrane protein
MRIRRLALFPALLTALSFCGFSASAQPHQDTLRLQLPEAEKMFLDSNLQLLAQRYNIDANQALVIQARLWPNPNFSIGHTLVFRTAAPVLPYRQQ